MNEQREQAFLAELWRVQGRSGLNDTDLARQLGVHASLLTHMKSERGQRGKNLSLRFALAAVEVFPELRCFLLSELPTVNDVMTADSEVA